MYCTRIAGSTRNERRTGDEELAVGANLEALDAGGARDADGARGGRDLRVVVRLPAAQPLAHVPASAAYARALRQGAGVRAEA